MPRKSKSNTKNGRSTRSSKSPVTIVPNKKDAVFGRGRKRDHVRKGSLYRYLIEKNWTGYSDLDVSKHSVRKAFVKSKIVDVMIKKGGRFIVRDGEDKYFLHPQNAEHLKLIYKKIQRALFNERKRREMAEEESIKTNTPSKVFGTTLYESEYESEAESEHGDDEDSVADSVADLVEDEDIEEDMEEELVAAAEEPALADDDEIFEEARPRSRASLKLDQLAYLAATLLEEDSEASENEESSVVVSPPATESRLPFKKRKSAHESYEGLFNCVKEGKIYGGSAEFNQAWMNELRRELFPFYLHPRVASFEEHFNHPWGAASIAPFFAAL